MTRTFRLGTAGPDPAVDFERDLNEQQRAVVLAPGGPMLVIAGAGSGKTRTLIYRLARLLQQGVPPSAIMLVTFTNRSAREMLHRVEQLVRQDALHIWGGTFHHVANRLLREYGGRLGLAPDFTILDREDAADLLAAAVAETGVDGRAQRFPKPAALLSMSSLAASTRVPLEVVLESHYPMFLDLTDAIAQVLHRYALRKRAHQMLDYDDLLGEWLRLLEEHADVAADLSARFRHVLVDEYQDTNAIQARIVDLVAAAHRNVCVVGDDSQSIYSFRGASVENMLGFRRRYPDGREYRLEINYRSTPEILDLANGSIARNRRRLDKVLRAVRPAGLRPALVPCADHMVQARFIGEYILHLFDEGRGPFDVAVLYRSHWHALEIQLELHRRNIPFQVRGGVRFFEQAHIKDALAFLRLRHNGHDELAWRRVLRLLPRIGLALAQRVWTSIADSADPLAAARSPATAAQLPPHAQEVFARFALLLEELSGLIAPAAMLERVLARFYADHLEGHYADAELRRRDIESVAAFAAQYRTVEAFLSEASLEGDFSGETCVDGPDEQEFVTLSTVHQAKGLEWPAVFIPWVADGRFPTDLAMGSLDDLEEERRVFHVALTRAKDELYLIVPQVWSAHRGVRALMKPSRFITELERSDLLETMILEGDVPEIGAG
jgi:DNA helicase-2/ATP-dependent DNA helicase PcrA